MGYGVKNSFYLFIYHYLHHESFDLDTKQIKFYKTLKPLQNSSLAKQIKVSIKYRLFINLSERTHTHTHTQRHIQQKGIILFAHDLIIIYLPSNA